MHLLLIYAIIRTIYKFIDYHMNVLMIAISMIYILDIITRMHMIHATLIGYYGLKINTIMKVIWCLF